MNNRSPFIPNIPSGSAPQGMQIWGDPSQLFSTGQHLQQGSSSNNSQQLNLNVHQQNQQTTYVSTPSHQSASASAIFADWANNQLQSYSNAYQQAGLSTVAYQQQQVISNVQRSMGVPLNLETSTFVPFPVNLSPQGVSHVSLPSIQQIRQQRDPSPMGMESPYIISPPTSNSRGTSQMQQGYIQSHGQGQGQFQVVSTSNSQPTYIPILNLNSRVQFASSGSPSPPPLQQGHGHNSQVQTVIQGSMSPYSGSSTSTPSPTPQQLAGMGNSSSGSGRFHQPSQSQLSQQQQQQLQSMSGVLFQHHLQTQSPSPSIRSSSQVQVQNRQHQPMPAHQSHSLSPGSSGRASSIPTYSPSSGPPTYIRTPSPQRPLQGPGIYNSYPNLTVSQIKNEGLPAAAAPVVKPTPPKKERKPRAPRKKKEPAPTTVNASVGSGGVGGAPSMPDLSNLQDVWKAPVQKPAFRPLQQGPTPYSIVGPPGTRPLNVNQAYLLQNLYPPRPSVIQNNSTPPTTTATTPNKQQGTEVSGAESPQRRNSSNNRSPLKGQGSLNNLLDYAMEKAGIAAVFDPSTELTRIVGSGDTPGSNANTTILDLDAHNAQLKKESAGEPTTGPATDFDLDAELSKFYNPPSPKDNQKGGNHPNNSAGHAARANAQTTTAPSRTTTTTAAVAKSSPSKNKAGNSKVSQDDDDDLQVVLVKITKKGTNRRRVPQTRGRPAPTQNPTGRGQPAHNAYQRPGASTSGRVLAVAPKTTVPIPPKDVPERNLKTTARKSTAPLPPDRKRSPQRKVAIAITTPTPTPVKVRPISPEPEPKLTRAAARLQGKNNSSLVMPTPVAVIPPGRKRGNNATQVQIATHTRSQPPIKMKVNLKQGTVSSMPTDKRPGPRSRTNPAPAPPSPKSRQSRSTAGRIKASYSSYISSDEDDSDLFTAVKRRRSHPPKPLPDYDNDEDEDLQILKEIRPDSDDSYDPEGERDEASSETETDDEKEENVPLAKRRKGKVENAKIEEIITTLVEEENQLSPPDFSPKQLSPEHFDSSEPPSPPFKNINEPEPEISRKPDEPEDKKVKVVENEEPSSSSSEDEEEEIPQVFEMPKPAVILKGTKEDADKAVVKMRETLAQLSKFNFPVFLKK